MKILVLADQPSKQLWDHYEQGKLDGIDLIISCGDLPASYLSFLVTMVPIPLFYVCGNHDDIYERMPPEGCECIDGKVVNFRGVRIAGLGGSMRYTVSGVNMYTEKKMRKRVRKLSSRAWLKGGVDLFVAHSPAYGHNDGQDLPHRGFQCFHSFLKRFHPKYFVHGHMHMTYGRLPRVSSLGETTVINAYERYIIEI